MKIKRFYFLFIMLAMLTVANAAYLRNVPLTLNQPDGTKFECFATGDEFYNYLHDANGYTIILNPQTGFYVYANLVDDNLVPTQLIAGRSNPAESLTPNLNISAEKRMEMRKAWDVPEHLKIQKKRTRETNHGRINNIVIFIRFADDNNFTNSFTTVNNMFNINTSSMSMQEYFQEVSYNQLDIQTYFYPAPSGNQIISFQDSHKRGYFQEYSSYNPEGYQGGNNGTQRTEREHKLLKDAVDYINSNHMVPQDLNVDYDNDGYVDNVCFIVRGEPGAWSSLLWPHQWSLYNEEAYINNKRVYTFNFQLADAGQSYFGTSTMCHEMNHSLGAPDLYHYYYGTDLHPVGNWDLMEYNETPPQSMGAYMKYRYGNWIDNIPEITTDGTYSLHDLSSSTNNCYKIASPNPREYYVLEYRRSSVEPALYGSGLLIYRINTDFDGMGNMSYDGSYYFDEVYLYRPGGTMYQDGSYYYAFFNETSGRTKFSSSTNPQAFLTNGDLDQNIHISSVSAPGETISFKVTFGGQDPIETLDVKATKINDSKVNVRWSILESQNYTFDDSSLQGWTTIDADQDGFCWRVGTEKISEGNGHNNSKDFVLSQSYDFTQGKLYPDNYLVCPTQDYYKQISFWACAQDANYPAEHFSVEVSTTSNTNPSSFTTIQEWTMTAKDQGTWKQYTVDLSQYEGQKIWVAIRHFNCSDQFYLNVDDISLTKGNSKMERGMYTVYRINVTTEEQTTLSSNVSSVSYNDNGWGSVAPGNYQWGVQTNGTSTIFWSNLITKEIIQYDINLLAIPSEGGAVYGAGTYEKGETITVSATPNEGYQFISWKEASGVVSTNPEYTFKVTSDRTLVAMFELIPIPTYEITVTADPTNGGKVTGAGTYEEGETVTVTAEPNENFVFINWTEYGVELSKSSEYSFEAIDNMNLVANFKDVTGVEENDAVEAKVYPNPTDGEMRVRCENMQHITIISIKGEVVYDKVASSDEEVVDMSQFAKGTYVVRIITDGGVVTRTATVVK